jgi:preprotein translocase subunit YajC
MSDFFINNAYAQAAGPAGGGMGSLFMFGMLFVVFYFFLIRPQMKQAKEQKQMVESLTKGDEIVTSGGMLGRINKVGDNFLLLEIAKDVEIKVQKHAVSATLPKGTSKTL